jgi:cytochrome c6
MMRNQWIVFAAAAASILMLMLPACSPEQGSNAQKSAPVPVSPAGNVPAKTGEELFRQYCATCHPEGGNVSDPGKNLRRSTLRANHLTRPEEIVRVMRHPLSRMITFDSSTISDQDARAIAEYVLATF